MHVKGDKEDLFEAEQRWRKRRMFSHARSKSRWRTWLALLLLVLLLSAGTYYQPLWQEFWALG